MSRPKQPTPSWRSAETRHYCQVCNVWMGNDRQSILLHENGKKHVEKMEQSLQDRRDAKVAQDKQAQQLQSSLQAMEQAAMASMTGGDAQYYDTSALATAAAVPQPPAFGGMYAQPVHSGGPPPPPPPPPPKQKQKQPPAAASTKKEKQAWNARKKQRQDEKAKKRDGDDSEDDTEQTDTKGRPPKRRPIAPDEGHYTLPHAVSDDAAVVENDDNKVGPTKSTTYLEGIVFAELLEPEMPIQIWTGSNLSSAEERKLAHHQDLWMNGLVVSIQQRRQAQNWEDRMVVKVAYLKSPTDQDETLEEGVRLHRLRIVLGGDPDGNSIPTTLEEARILAMGGEEIDTTTAGADNNNNGGLTAAEIDEATGLSGWSTIKIKRTTVHQEAREERARERLKQQQARRKADDAAKEAATRKMEESKVANAEDSALGAFDVWSQTAKGGYKGVDIHTEATVTVADTAKRLAAKGETVAFKSSKAKFGKGKLAGKKRNRRTTSADDD